MIYERLVLLWILTNLVSVNWGRVIQDGPRNLDPVNVSPIIPDRITNGLLKSEGNGFKSRVRVRETCTSGDCEKKMLDVSDQNKKNETTCPYEKKELCLILSLSKIAKIQVADPSRESRIGGFASNVFDDKHVEISGGTSAEENRLPYDFINKHFEAEGLKDPREKHLKSPNVFCRAIRDVYIPEAKQKFPAYSCQFENRTFVLSSPRFLQDRRAYFGINIDEETFRRMKSVPDISGNNESNVIPALLVLKHGDSDYNVQTYEKVPNKRVVKE